MKKDYKTTYNRIRCLGNNLYFEDEIDELARLVRYSYRLEGYKGLCFSTFKKGND